MGNKEYNTRYYQMHKEEIAEKGKQKWALDTSFRERRRVYMRMYEKRIRLSVLSHYSQGVPKCSCCEETLYEFLCIDHIEGGGKAHRKEIGGSSNHLYAWLRRENHPKGFRVLCHNCNFSRGAYGYCPHKRKEEE